MFPPAADWARLEQQFPALRDSPELQDIAERHNKHCLTIRGCFYAQDQLLLDVQEALDEDPYFVDHDLENIILVNKEISTHQLP